MTRRVIFYSESGNPRCERVRAWLARHGVPFTERNVAIDVAARRELVSLGAGAPPIVVLGDRVVAGDDPEVLADLVRGPG